MRERITPQTYIDMNKEAEEEGCPLFIKVPTQEEIDAHRGTINGYWPEDWAEIQAQQEQEDESE